MCAKIVLNKQLIEKAFHFAPQITSTRDLIDLALLEFIVRHGRNDIRKLKGKVKIHHDYNYKALREDRKQ